MYVYVFWENYSILGVVLILLKNYVWFLFIEILILLYKRVWELLLMYSVKLLWN